MGDINLDFVGPGARLALAAAKRAETAGTGAGEAAAAIVQPLTNEATRAAGFAGRSDAITFAPKMATGELTTVYGEAANATRAAVAGEVRLNGTAATVGEQIPLNGVYAKQASGSPPLLRTGSLIDQRAALLVVGTEQLTLGKTLWSAILTSGTRLNLLSRDNTGALNFRASRYSLAYIFNRLADFFPELPKVKTRSKPGWYLNNGVMMLGLNRLGELDGLPVSTRWAKAIVKKGGGSGGSYDPYAGGLLPSRDIVMIGDSMTTPSVIAALAVGTGGTATKIQLGGQTAFSMAVAVGALPLTITVSGNSIPADGSTVAVTAKNTNILNNGGVNMGTVRVYFAVPGIDSPCLIETDSSGNWTIKREAAGAAIAVAAGATAILHPTNGTSFLPATNFYRDKTLIIRLGRNGDHTTRATRRTGTLDPIRAIIARLTPLCCRILIVSPYNGRAQAYDTLADNEGIGTAAYTMRMQLNAEMQREFPHQWIDMRSWAVQSAIYDMSLTPTSDDLADMAKDCIPRQLFKTGDNIHVTDDTGTAEGGFLAKAINALRWN